MAQGQSHMAQGGIAAPLLAALIAEQAGLVAYATQILHDRSSAEDVVQEVVLKLCEEPGAETLRGRRVEAPLHYLRRMVRNAAIDWARRSIRERCRFVADDQADAVAAPCTCPQDRLEQCQALKAALAALETTSERTRRVFLAHRIDGVPQTVLARENGVSPTLVNFMIRDGTALCRSAAA
ncbi:sigma-70 family RNA polymerase sigma factor [Methylobacterium sp. 77]|uniref:sigma-70 family RNA polymerase sigma factor n=1 Tax=Methylobacterium sp. 77 TaxID=1101192 RepID=UPI00039CDA47|nr:sigma-70 family RNA polymerase sigma factor [Methylobacterium sp. 77]